MIITKIERRNYLRQLIDSKDNGLIKIVTGLRRVGKSYLLNDEERMRQEKRSLQQISDSFKKIVIVGDRMKLRRDEQGIVLMGIYEFLSDKTLLDA